MAEIEPDHPATRLGCSGLALARRPIGQHAPGLCGHGGRGYGADGRTTPSSGPRAKPQPGAPPTEGGRIGRAAGWCQAATALEAEPSPLLGLAVARNLYLRMPPRQRHEVGYGSLQAPNVDKLAATPNYLFLVFT